MKKPIKIDNLDKLYNAALARRSVYSKGERMMSSPRPAAFVMNMSGHTLRRLFIDGLYIYEPKASRYGKWTQPKELPF